MFGCECSPNQQNQTDSENHHPNPGQAQRWQWPTCVEKKNVERGENQVCASFALKFFGPAETHTHTHSNILTYIKIISYYFYLFAVHKKITWSAESECRDMLFWWTKSFQDHDPSVLNLQVVEQTKDKTIIT